MGNVRAVTDPSAPWWKSGVVYQIYPRSFADGTGDGMGDLRGIIDHVDHLVDLGVDAVWLSPFYESPMHDMGYDVSDHRAVDPLFGTLDDFDELVALLHHRGIRIIVDFVPNHVSSEHPWFLEAVSDPDSDKRDWFIWADPAPDGGPPFNWTASFTNESAWELDEASGQYYLHLFLPEQPDVNWANPELEAGPARRVAVLARPGRRRVPHRRDQRHRQGSRILATCPTTWWASPRSSSPTTTRSSR